MVNPVIFLHPKDFNGLSSSWRSLTMTITSAIVLLSVYWFIILFIILPINVTTQNDERNIIEGTAPSSP